MRKRDYIHLMNRRIHRAEADAMIAIEHAFLRVLTVLKREHTEYIIHRRSWKP